MVKTKDKKKRLENSKFWVAAGLTAVAVGGVTTVEPQFWDFIDDEMHQTYAATVNSTTTIDQVKDVDTENGQSRDVNWGATPIWNNSEVDGLGTYKPTGNPWVADRNYNGGNKYSKNGAYYTKLVADGQTNAGYTYLNRQFDATKPFTISGYLHPGKSDSNTTLVSNYSDWTGLLLTPTNPDDITKKYSLDSYGGSGLGIRGMAKAFALGIDFNVNTSTGYNDPSATSPFAALRTTDASGNLVTPNSNLYKSGVSNWQNTIRYTLTWNPTGGPDGKSPSIVATMTPDGGSTWTIDTKASGVTLQSVSALTFGLNAINGNNAGDQYALMDNVTGTFSTGTTTVKYVDQNGKEIKTATSFIANVGETVGITGLSSGVDSADYGYAAPTIKGYTVSAASAVKKVSQTASDNVITITYAEKPTQQANIQTNMPALWNGSSTIASYTTKQQDMPLGNSSSLAASISDESLVRSGYSYYVTGPNGASYATMASASAATTNVWDSTANAVGSADSTPQTWTVNYVANPQQANLYVQYFAPSGGSWVSSGSSSLYASAVGSTGGSISFTATDSQITAASGYRYVIYGPDNKSYTTLSAAQSAYSFDSTNNTTTDASAQNFWLYYYPAMQFTSLVVDANSPVNAASVLASSYGYTNTALALPYTDTSLSAQGYSYVVKGPNGSEYSNLSAAMSANAMYDATTNTSNTDSSAQVFTASYVPQYQAAQIQYAANGPVSAGAVLASTAGTTNNAISFATSDGDLARVGYTYTVTYPGDSVSYATLSAALAAHGKYDNTSNAGTSDASGQVFTVNYKTNQYAVLQTTPTDTSSHSVLSYSAVSESANGPASSAISFSTTDSQLARSGYTYSVVVKTIDSAGSILGSVLASYTTLASALAAQKYDNNLNDTNATVDAQRQLFEVVYSPESATVTYHYVDENGTKLIEPVSSSGVVGAKIDDRSMVIPGYTLTGPDTAQSDTDGIYDADKVSTVTYVYRANHQEATLAVDSASPTAANSAITSASGVTSGSISFNVTDAQLAKTGYTYTIIGPTGSSYANLTAALASNALYDNTTNGSATTDSSAQSFRVLYKANVQSAQITVQEGSPISGGASLDAITGVTSGAMSFKVNDTTLPVSGYTYRVGVGYDTSNITWYATLSEALSANAIFDNTDNTGTTDTKAQFFYVSYAPMSQAATVAVTSDSPISAGSTVLSAAGSTGSAISFASNVSYATLDSQLAKSGYTYTVKYGSDATAYTTLSSALAAHNKYNSNNTTSGTSDANPDVFTVSYKADSQTAILAVTSNSPVASGSIADSASGVTSGSLAFTMTDSGLAKRGYTYTVTGPDGSVYSNLSAAVAANSLFDNTNNPVSGSSDTAIQSFLVSYKADYQTAEVVLGESGPYASDSVFATTSGVTSGSLSFSITDADLALSGYTYQVQGPNSEWYDTLAEAQSDNTTFDNTSNAGDSDAETQMFLVSYTAMSQAATIVGAADSPISAGMAIESAAGVTSEKISFTHNDSSLSRSGYSYVVYMGSDSGTTYSTLSAALAANSLYNNTNTTDSDADPQVFTVSYVANYQSANLVIGGDTQISSGVTLDSAAGVTSGRVSFATTDSALALSGYTYTIQTPNGTVFDTLSAAVAGSQGLYDNTTNAGTSDATPQTFTVVYAAITQTAEVVVGETSDIYSGQVLAKVTGDTGATLGLTLTDADLANMEMTHGYTYTVTVQNADGTMVVDADGNPVHYATLADAVATNDFFDAVNTGIKKFILNPVASYQESTLTVTSESPISAGVAVETASGVTDGQLSFAMTDASLALSGYTYTVTVVNADGTRDTYNTLSAAVSAVSSYDSTINGSGSTDSSAQAFEVSYKADYQSANVNFATADGDKPMPSIVTAGVTSGAYTSTYTAADGYYFVASGQPSGVSVAADGRTATLTFNYDNTTNLSATDSSAQTFNVLMAEASQSGEISYSYSNVVGSPTVPDAVPIAGVTGDTKSGTITAPDGYYIVSVTGDQYSVVYTDETHQEATYSVILDDTNNGNETSDTTPQNLLVVLAPNNQTATLTEVMPTGSSSVVDTQNDRTADSYSYTYTAPAGYYIASDGVTPASGVTASISADGTTVTLTGTYDNSKDLDEAGTDSAVQNTAITLTQATQLAEFKVVVPSWAKTVSAKLNTIEGKTGEAIIAPTGYTDAELAKDGYTYSVKGPDGTIYDTMAEALAANATFDDSNNGSGSDVETQTFEVTYTAQNQTVKILQQYADGTTNGPAYPQSDPTLNGKTDQQVTGTITAPTGYEIVDITQVDGVTWEIAADNLSATYTITYDTITEEAPATRAMLRAATDGTVSQESVVTYGPLDQTVNVTFKDEVGRILTSDTGKNGHALEGKTNEAVDYDDASLATDKVIDGYTITSDTTDTATNYDDDTSVAQDVTFVYRDTQAPTVTTTKTELVSSKDGLPADEAAFLSAVGYATTDNQQYGDSTVSTDYDSVMNDVKADGKAREVTITVKDATGNTTTKTVMLTVVDTAPVSQEADVQTAQKNLDDLVSDPNASDADVATAKEALEQAIQDAQTQRDEAKDAAQAASTSDETQAVADDPGVVEAQQALQDAIDNADADTGTTQAITDATAALENAVARAEAGSVDTAPVSQEEAVMQAQSDLDDVLDNPDATTAEVDAAKQALEDAVAQAKSDRADANTTADDTKTQVTDSQDDAVKQAVADLTAVQDAAANDDATTADIEQAVQKVVDAVKDAAQTALDQDASPVQNESTVSRAKDNLQDVLDNAESTPQEIVDATNAYNEAVADAKTARDDATKAAEDQITTTNNSNQVNDASVIDAKNKLQDLLDKAATGDADALTADIEQATQDLADAVAAAGGAQDAARTAADEALTKTAPVTYEPNVQEKIDALNDLLANETATADQINDATAALTSAVNTATTQRTSANDDAATAISQAQSSNQSEEPTVQAAEKALQDLVDQAKTNTEDALTADIRDAIKNLQDAISQAASDQDDARDAAHDAITAASPVSNEAATKAALDNLQTVLANENATTAEIQEATQAVTAASKTDKADRDAMNTKANDAVTAAQTGNQATEPGVIDAIKNLQDLQTKAATDDADALTADIDQAIADLATAQETAAGNQETARDAAKAAIAETEPVSYEDTVSTARKALDKLLADPAASTQDIQNATKALTEATAAEKDKRDAINTEADSYITDVQNSAQASEPTVVSALNALQEMQAEAATDSSAALTADIAEKLAELKTAVNQAATAQEAAKDKANEALNDLQPVSNEPGVETAKAALEKVLANDTATAQEITDATQKLLNETADAKADRSSAETDAQNTITKAMNSEQSEEPAVQEAIDHLNQVMSDAANDSPDALTADIDAARKALDNALATAQAAQEQARKDAASAIAQASPVSHELATAQTINALNAVLANPDATASEIATATAALNTAATADKGDRDAANAAGTQAIADAQGSDQVNEPAVKSALQELQLVMSTAATDTADALSQDILDAIQTLADARDAAAAKQDTARQDATDALAQTAPLSNEKPVADAVRELKNLLANPTSTAAQIADATQAVRNAVSQAQPDRDAANTAADDAIAQVPSDLADEPSVSAAVANLKKIQEQAAADNPNSLTADINAATKALADTIKAAEANRNAARDAASSLLGKTAPLSNEAAVSTAKDALQKLLDDPNAITTAIENATAALQAALQKDGASRQSTNTAADKLVAEAKNPAIANNEAVAQAMQHLQAVQAAAAQDSASDLTADIAAAMTALQNAMQDANNALDALRQDASDLISQAKPVSHEADVAPKVAALQKLLDDPSATRDQIQQAMDDLQNATATAKTEREAANQSAHDAIAAANQSAVSGDPAVQEALAKLQAIMLAASNDSATDLTADILKAMQALQDAVQSAESRAAVVVQPTSSVPPVNGVLAYTANPTTRLLAGSTVTRSGVLPYTGYHDDWYLMALGIFMFSANLLFVATKRRKKDEEVE
ncbi:MucBP domain-containing protein [Weissella confusa]|uniref:MucBP domain-containing protein n=1 Tax=Weissella confusa TaxID=1583 RepID=UPI0018A01F01|nr:MucBP domain-containing protein [Weissella confusa]MBF7058731.1 MucBP domain-containing protein [Weissella confusa]